MENKVQKEGNKLVHVFAAEDARRVAAEMLHLRFMKTIKTMMAEMTKKELAERLGTSKAYISKLFYGDKRFNAPLLSDLERVFQGRFTLTFKPNASILSLTPPEQEISFQGHVENKSDEVETLSDYDLAA